MKKNRSKLYTFLAIILAALFLYLALRKVSWEEIVTIITHGKPLYLALAIILYSCGLSFRVYRWENITKNDKTSEGVHFSFAFWAYGIGSLANNLFPARAGDLIRAIITGQKTDFSTAQALATVLTERVLDTILLLIIGVTALFGIQAFSDTLPMVAMIIAIVIAAFIIVLMVYIRYSIPIKQFISKIQLPLLNWDTLFTFVDKFIDGFRVLRSFKQISKILLLSMLIWLWDAIVTMTLSKAFDINFTLFQAFALLAALGLSSAIPSTPGYIGVYQYVAVIVLVPFGLSESQALVYVLAYQIMTYLIIMIWGGSGLLRLNMNFKTLNNSEEIVP